MMLSKHIRSLRQAAVSWLLRKGPSHWLAFRIVQLFCLRRGATLHRRATYLALRVGKKEMRLAPHHFAYCVVMSERFDYYFCVVESNNEDGFEVVDFSSPRLQRYCGTGLEFELASFPEEQAAIDDYFRWYTPGSGETVFDIGANCGVSSYEFSRRVGPTGRVYAMEPDPINFSLLQHNIERHNLKNVTALQIAVSNACGAATFNSEGTIGSGLEYALDRPTTGKKVEVKTVTLEEACRLWGVPNFCKIDIEGAEIEVLRDSVRFLSTHSIQLVLDTHHYVRGVKTTRECEDFLRKAHYRVLSGMESGSTMTWAAPEISA
jgi:FkbM family methyltransferase